MIDRVIVIGDSHVVPLKKAFESLHIKCQVNYIFLPFKYIKATMPGFVVNNKLIYKKVLDKKNTSFYGSVGLSASNESESDEIHSIPLENSKVYLVGMGLGIDSLLRNFSEEGTLNREGCVDLPLYSSQAKNYSRVKSLTDFSVYQDDFIDYLISQSVQQSKSLKIYKCFINSNFHSVQLLPLPFVSFASLNYYSRSDLTLIPSELYLYTIKKWLDCVSTDSAIINPFKLMSDKYLSQDVLLAENETFSSKPSDIHMSIQSCKKTINYIHSSLCF